MNKPDDVFMRVWLVNDVAPETYALSSADYLKLEEEFDLWVAEQMPQTVATFNTLDGRTVSLNFEDIRVRQMTLRSEFEVRPDGGFETLEEIMAQRA